MKDVVQLSNTINTICDMFIGDFFEPFHNSSTLGYSEFNEFKKPNSDLFKLETIPSYPVTSTSFDENGTLYIEVTTTGFRKDEISIIRDDNYLIVESKKADTKDEIKKTSIYNKIGKRNFKIAFECNDKADWDNYSATMEYGILTIEIPIKKEFKPVKQELKIN